MVSDSSMDGGDSSSSSSDGDEGSAHQAAGDDETSFSGALGSSNSPTSCGDEHANNRAAKNETSLCSDVTNRNSDRGQGADGVRKVDEDTSEVHVGDQARIGGTKDEVEKARWTSLAGILRQRAEASPVLLGTGVTIAAVFIFMVAIGQSPSLFAEGG